MPKGDYRSTRVFYVSRPGISDTSTVLTAGPKSFDGRDLGGVSTSVEFRRLDWVCGYSDKRLLEPIDDIPPAAFEQMDYLRITGRAS
jgi:hypothetical protein